MVRTPLTDEQRDRGRALVQILRAARGPRPAAAVAHEAGISLDTLRKIERGGHSRTGVLHGRVLDLDLDLTTLATTLYEFDRTTQDAAAS